MSKIDVTKYPDAVKAMTAWNGSRANAASSGVAAPDQDARVADERLRVLHRHAYEGCACGGETEQRLYGLSAWQETPFYTPRERAALEWAETLTLIASHHVPDELYAGTRSTLPKRSWSA